MKTIFTKYRVNLIVLFFGMAMMIAGFLTPPKGVIDGSVLTGLGEIFAFCGAITGLEKYKEVSRMKYMKEEKEEDNF